MTAPETKDGPPAPTPPRVAPVFDVVDRDHGPYFLATRPVLRDLDEIHRLAAYLAAGEPVVIGPILSVDVLDPELNEVVPLNLRTDGTWVWSDATTYYLETYGVAPDPHLLVHLRTRGVYSWEPEEAEIERIREFVEQALSAAPVADA